MLRDPNVSRRHAELRRAASGDWTIVDLGSTNGIKVNGRRVASTPAQPRRPGDGRHDDLPVRHRAVGRAPVDYDPISVALKFGFLAVLYLFLLWIARSALKDLRRTVAPAPDATGFHQAPAFAPQPRPRRRLAGRRARRRPRARASAST